MVVVLSCIADTGILPVSFTCYANSVQSKALILSLGNYLTDICHFNVILTEFGRATNEVLLSSNAVTEEGLSLTFNDGIFIRLINYIFFSALIDLYLHSI